MEPVYLFLVFFFGLLFGSFANVCIYRLAEDQSLYGRSYCRLCKKKIAWFDNIPILSFLFLHGKCRHCKKEISKQYPLVEFLVALTFVIIFYLFNLSTTSLYLCFIFFIYICIFFIDLKHFIIPNSLNYILIITGLLKNFDLNLNSIFQNSYSSLLGCIVGYLLIWSIIVFYKKIKNVEAMGLGDAKLLAGIGAWFGLPAVFMTIFFASVAGLIFVLPSLINKKKNLSTAIPFGPYIILGNIVYLFFGEKVLKLLI